MQISYSNGRSGRESHKSDRNLKSKVPKQPYLLVVSQKSDTSNRKHCYSSILDFNLRAANIDSPQNLLLPFTDSLD